jgi:plasmid stabilization system protein ParE
MNLVVSQAAERDFVRLHAFLANKSPSAADKAIARLIAAVQSLDIFPERGRPTGTPNVRELIIPFGRSGYVLRYAYSPSKDEIVIIRVWHGREARE